MVNMSRRLADSDSDEEVNSSSDEDNGNFKRRRRHYSSSAEEDFVTKTLKTFVTPEPQTVSKPLKTTVAVQQEKQLIQKQRVLNEKLSKLPTYDDLFNSAADDCVQTSSVTSYSSRESVSDDTKPRIKTTCIEVTEDNQKLDEGAGGDSKDANSKSSDPRLRRSERFKELEQKADITEKLNAPTLMRRVNDLLNERDPMEAYIHLKAIVTPLDLHKHVDLLMVMAKDWFPSQMDKAYDPRSVFIKMEDLHQFSNLMRDLFATKTKSKEFWESVIISTEKFIDESRIRSMLSLLTKLRWILVKDIRDYLISEDIKIGMKASNILVDHRIKLECKRAQHRKEFEANFRSQSAIDNFQSTSTSRPTPTPSRPVVPQQTPAPPQIISGLPVLIPTPDCPEPTSVPSMPPIDMFDNQMEVPVKALKQTPFPPPPPNGMNNENKLKYDITECLKNDQYFKLIQMMNRHTFKRKLTFIELLGEVLRELVERIPQLSVFEIYQKLHDTIILNKNEIERADRTDPFRLEFIFSRLLKEFHETVALNPKEWILMRDRSREEYSHFRTEINPFYEPYWPVVHNIIVDCGYTSKDLIVKYEAIEENIPLSPPNKMMADPRTNKIEVKTTEAKKPEAKKLEVKKTMVKKIQVKKLEVKKIEAKKPEVKKIQVKKPEVKKVEAKKPEVKKIQVKKPEVKTTEVKKIVSLKTTPVIKKVIKIPNNNSYLNELELKKIIRRVSISSSDESSNDE